MCALASTLHHPIRECASWVGTAANDASETQDTGQRRAKKFGQGQCNGDRLLLGDSSPGSQFRPFTFGGWKRKHTRIHFHLSFCAPLRSLSLHFTFLHFRRSSYIPIVLKQPGKRVFRRKLTSNVIRL